MKLVDLLNKIANGEIKEGVEFKHIGGERIYKVDNGKITNNGFETLYVLGEKSLNEKIEIIEDKPKGRWKPKEEGATYFSINDWGAIFQTHYNNAPKDWFRILNKNVFKTDSEAKEYLEYKTALSEAEKPFELGECNYSISFDIERKTLCLCFSSVIMEQGTIYLGTDEDVAQAFIDKWRKQILKYEFGIEEQRI